jgi:hypothetical protein
MTATKKIYIQPRATYGDYTNWTFKTVVSHFEFTYNSRTKLLIGERIGDNEYSGMGDQESRRVIGELNLVLEGLS